MFAEPYISLVVERSFLLELFMRRIRWSLSSKPIVHRNRVS